MPALPSVTLDPNTNNLVVSAAAVTGVGSAAAFGVVTNTSSRSHTLTLEAVGVGAVPTTVTVTLQASMDGGVTYQPYGSGGAGIALVATGAGTIAIIQNVNSGLLYQVNITSLTLGSATAVNVYANAN